MGGLRETLEIEGFLQNRQHEMAQADEESGKLGPFLEAWFDQFGPKAVKAKGLLEVARKRLPGFADPSVTARKLGLFRDKHREVVFNGQMLEVLPNPNEGNSYRLLNVSA